MKSIEGILASIFLLSAAGLPLRAETGLEQLQGAAPRTLSALPEVKTESVTKSGAPDYKPGSFALAAARAFRGHANYITLYAIPSPHRMDWTNLATLAFSYARNKAAVSLTNQTRSIGHVAFEIGCTLEDGRRTLVVTGQAPKDKSSMNGFADQAKNGAGYSAFFDSVPGRMETRAALETEQDTLSNLKNEVAFLTLKVSRQSCLEAQRYIKAYEDEKVSSRYGLGIRPLYKEGGGCANVGVSVVEVAGPEDFRALSAPWSRTFYIPAELLGGAENHVGLGTVASYWKYDWSKKAAGAHKVLFFYDPDLLYNWIRAPKPGQPAWETGAPKFERYAINSSAGLTLDYTAASSPTQWWKTDK